MILQAIALWVLGTILMAATSTGEITELKAVVYMAGLVLIGAGFAYLVS